MRTLITIITAVLILVSARAYGGENPFQDVRPDSVDLHMAVDWDYDEPPADGASREQIVEALDSFADSTYVATEGRLRICKVYVQNSDDARASADIFLSREVNRANATLGGLKLRGGQILAYLRERVRTESGDEFVRRRDPITLGIALAHEFGHYGLSLRDEYFEPLVPGKQQDGVKPQVCDVRLSTLMGDYRQSDSLSLPATYDEKFPAWTGKDGASKKEKYASCAGLEAPAASAPNTEDARWRTSHWREYERSAWEVIAGPPVRRRVPAEPQLTVAVHQFASIREGGVPTTLRRPRYDRRCFEPIFLDGTAAIVAIDRSRSMQVRTGSGDETYFSRAKTFARVYVQSVEVGATVGVLQFAGDVSFVVPPTKVTDEATRSAIVARIDDLRVTDDNTSLHLALDAAHAVLTSTRTLANRRYVVAFTDGDVAKNEPRLKKLVDARITVFGVAVGPPAYVERLRAVTDLTRGRTRGLSSWRYDEIEAILERNDSLARRTFTANDGAQEPLVAPMEISELDGDTSFRASWAANDRAVFELVTPTGEVLTSSSVVEGVRYELDAAGGTFEVTAPALGRWTPRVVRQSVATGDVHLDVRSDTTLRMTVDVEGGQQYPDPFFLRARLFAPAPVVGAKVEATLRPGGAVLPLRDDGVAPDALAGDGVYTVAISALVDDGEYTVDVRASNPGGAAVDASALADEPSVAAPPIPLSAFERTETVSIESKLWKAMPQTAADALPVRNDLTPIWVTINAPGDVVWLEFNGYDNGRYLAMTGSLISNDGQPMRTKLSLYDTDQTTILGSDAAADGTAAVALDTPDADGKYYLEVEHAAGGVGRFQVAVAPREWLATDGTEGEPETEQGGGLFAGCGCQTRGAPSPQVALVVLVVFAASRRRRAR